MGYAKRTLGDKMKKWDGAPQSLRRQLREAALLTVASAAQCASSC